MLATLVGALLVYAGASHQRFTSGGARPSLRIAGWVVLVITFVLMLRWFDVPAAIFTWITFVMLPWSLVPLAVARLDWRRKGYK